MLRKDEKTSARKQSRATMERMHCGNIESDCRKQQFSFDSEMMFGFATPADEKGIKGTELLQTLIAEYEQAENRECILMICLVAASVILFAILGFAICGALSS